MKEIVLEEGEEIKLYKHEGKLIYATNYGRFFNKNGKQLKTREHKGTICICLRHNYNRYLLSCARIVYKLFVDPDLQESDYIVYKDKDRKNIKFDNLTIGLDKRKIEGEVEPKLLELYLSNWTYNLIKGYIINHYDLDCLLRFGATKEDLVQETYLLLWKAIHDNFNFVDDKQWCKLVTQIIKKYIFTKYTYDLIVGYIDTY